MTVLDMQNNCAAISSNPSKLGFSDFSNVRPQASINFHLMSGWPVPLSNILSALLYVLEKTQADLKKEVLVIILNCKLKHR